VKLVDANVLLYAVNDDEPRHEMSREWLDDALSGDEVIGFAWVVVLAFLRLVTKPGLFPSPLPVDAAIARVRAWLAQENAVVVEPAARHLEVLAGLLDEVGSGANLVNDAHLAAIAVEHDATVVTFDTDFARFRGIRVERPNEG
jgi:uncharacterized protein